MKYVPLAFGVVEAEERNPIRLSVSGGGRAEKNMAWSMQAQSSWGSLLSVAQDVSPHRISYA